MQCNLWDVHAGMQNMDAKPRAATELEVKAYMVWQRQRRGLPEFSTFALQWKVIGRGAKAHRLCVGATFGGDHETGAYSIVMPGHNAHRQTVTMETLNDAGETVASSTMPLEPKKGGLIWSAADVRAAHGKIRKGQPRITPDLCEELPATPASAATVEQESISPAIATPEASDALSGPEIVPEAVDDPLADVLARLSALESQLATLSGERATTPIGGMKGQVAVQDRPRADRARRERMVRRYLAMRAERVKARQQVEIWQAHCDTWADQVTALEQANERLKDKRRHNAQRARRMIASARADVIAANQSATASRAALAALRASLADPARPERASDIARLVQERDTARNALAALQHRQTSMQAALDSSAQTIEDFGLRLAKAEAAVRRMAA